jgi:hypothetical protein
MVLAASAMVAACGSSNPTPGGSSGGGGGGGGGGHSSVFSGTVMLTGGSTLTGTFKDTKTASSESCSDYVTGSAAVVYAPPAPDSGTTVGGEMLAYTVLVYASAGYHGAGTYMTHGMIISVGSMAYGLTSNNEMQTITVTADGSGSLTFSNLPDELHTANESGTISWTCQ